MTTIKDFTAAKKIQTGSISSVGSRNACEILEKLKEQQYFSDFNKNLSKGSTRTIEGNVAKAIDLTKLITDDKYNEAVERNVVANSLRKATIPER